MLQLVSKQTRKQANRRGENDKKNKKKTDKYLKSKNKNAFPVSLKPTTLYALAEKGQSRCFFELRFAPESDL